MTKGWPKALLGEEIELCLLGKRHFDDTGSCGADALGQG
jgi:hypothetical protein